MRSPSGDPTAYRIRGALIALRREQADAIQIERAAGGGGRMTEPLIRCLRLVSAHNAANLQKLGVDMSKWDYVVALAGNPNTGKSTVFNALTGLRQHTGNWPGKTVARAEGGFAFTATSATSWSTCPAPTRCWRPAPTRRSPATSSSSGKPDVTVVVVDATRLERNLNLVLQVLEITDRVVVCLNLMDEAERHGIAVDAREAGARAGRAGRARRRRAPAEGIPELLLTRRSSRGGHAGDRLQAAPGRRQTTRPGARRVELVAADRSGLPGRCPTPAGWRCGCSTATRRSSRRARAEERANSATWPGRTGWRFAERADSPPAELPRRRQRLLERPRRCAGRWAPTSTTP